MSKSEKNFDVNCKLADDLSRDKNASCLPDMIKKYANKSGGKNQKQSSVLNQMIKKYAKKDWWNTEAPKDWWETENAPKDWWENEYADATGFNPRELAGNDHNVFKAIGEGFEDAVRDPRTNRNPYNSVEHSESLVKAYNQGFKAGAEALDKDPEIQKIRENEI